MSPVHLRELSAIAGDFNNFKGGPMPDENISTDIEKIKADGARKALGTAINDALWRIQGHSENARKEEYKNFGQCIAKIKEDVAKAESLYAEWKRLG